MTCDLFVDFDGAFLVDFDGAFFGDFCPGIQANPFLITDTPPICCGCGNGGQF